MTTELFSDAMLQAFDAATAPVDQARILPPVLYTSPEFHEFEKRAIFDREWYVSDRSLKFLRLATGFRSRWSMNRPKMEGKYAKAGCGTR